MARTILRYAVALLVITYGFAKLNGSQFTVLDSELDKPMGQVSGFWLTWYYFGYSKFYGNIIAVAQVFGGLLLMFRRTTLLGACLLLPIIANIILVDVFYAVDLGALLVALFIGGALLVILRPHAAELYELFWVRQQSPAAKPSKRVGTAARYFAPVLFVVLPAAFTYWVANYNNRFPTPVDGAWEVLEVSPNPAGAAAGVPSVIFFERNRAHLCVFKRGDGSYEGHHFEVNPGERTITIWDYWLRKGARIFDGSYEMSGGQLRLRGRYANQAGETTFVLRRRE